MRRFLLSVSSAVSFTLLSSFSLQAQPASSTPTNGGSLPPGFDGTKMPQATTPQHTGVFAQWWYWSPATTKGGRDFIVTHFSMCFSEVSANAAARTSAQMDWPGRKFFSLGGTSGNAANCVYSRSPDNYYAWLECGTDPINNLQQKAIRTCSARTGQRCLPMADFSTVPPREVSPGRRASIDAGQALCQTR